MSQEKHTESSITALLASKYSGSEWAFCSQVPNATGTQKSRTCDGLAMSLWPSRGLHLHGFEIKVSRSDWLNEIQDLSKATAFSRFCHYWWIVAPKGIVKLEEMPSDWGLMEAGNNLRTRKAATLRDPELPNHSLLAGIFRACNKQDDNTNAILAAERRGRREGIAEAEKRFEKQIDPDAILNKHKLERLEQSVAQFEAVSGLKVDSYNGLSLGKEVVLAQLLKTNLEAKTLERLKGTLEASLAAVVEGMEIHKKILEGESE